jgi:trehalose-phosphatase
MNPAADLTRRVQEHLNHGNPVWFFLDYDGTLADFAPTPEIVEPDSQLIHLLRRLSKQHRFRLTLISGRMLSQVHKLVPLDDIYLAGTYGIEIQLPGGEVLQRIDLNAVRPVLQDVKAAWTGLVQNLEGFFIEDKKWAVALHARYAEPEEAERVISQARQRALLEIDRYDLRLLGGHRFLEIGPTLADKGATVRWIWDQYPLPRALLVYLGDDDKDEQAFSVIHDRGGVCVLVGAQIETKQADYHFGNPTQVRNWLTHWVNAGEGSAFAQILM